MKDCLGKLNFTDIFVLFVSKNSMTSKHVQEEMQTAYKFLKKGSIKAILPIILDESYKYYFNGDSTLYSNNYKIIVNHIDNYINNILLANKIENSSDLNYMRWEPKYTKDTYAYYDHTADKHKKKHLFLIYSEIFASALIPFLAMLMLDYNSPCLKYALSLLGVYLVIISSLKVFNYDKLANIYRKTAEKIKYERERYAYGAYPYNNNENRKNINLLLDKIEKLAKEEMMFWDLLR